MSGRSAARLALAALLSMAAARTSAQEPQARSLWEQGQAAMKRGDRPQAIDYYERCLKQDPSFARAHLSIAAAYLEQNDERQALPHLASYVRAVPDHVIMRVHYAEILFRLQLFQEARAQFEEFLALGQSRNDVTPTLLIEVHSKLMEIGELTEDEYTERLHRGIGLYLLAGERARLGEPDGTLSVEGLLCRAVAELKDAADQRPQEARPLWYLYLTWTRLGERPQALRTLHLTEHNAGFSHMTPFEEQEMEFALRKAECSAPLRR
jgi:tetratricopeptide (TPR) repeat protein